MLKGGTEVVQGVIWAEALWTSKLPRDHFIWCIMGRVSSPATKPAAQLQALAGISEEGRFGV
jgi:hypothetical protein